MTAWRVSSYSGSQGDCVEVSTAPWRTSTYSGSSGECVEVGAASWHTSSHSGSEANCVEVGTAPTAVVVRDTKDRVGAQLAFPAQAWRSFATALKHR